jgi:hypothetical protein
MIGPGFAQAAVAAMFGKFLLFFVLPVAAIVLGIGVFIGWLL